MSKTSNNSLVVSNKAKKPKSTLKPVKQIFLGEYFSIQTFQHHPITGTFIEQEAKRIKQWADLDTSLRMTDFSDMRGYDPDTFYEWVAKYPLIAKAHKYALRRIGARREDGAISRKFDSSTIHRTLGYYDKVWKSETRELARMKEEMSSGNETKVVVIERFALPEDAKIHLRTPEEVAGEIHKSTREDRRIGSSNYKERVKNE